MENNSGLRVLQLYNDDQSNVTSRGIIALFRMLEKNTTLDVLGGIFQWE
jgi:hypothetical protein